jgi:hypothetical protein
MSGVFVVCIILCIGGVVLLGVELIVAPIQKDREKKDNNRRPPLTSREKQFISAYEKFTRKWDGVYGG